MTDLEPLVLPSAVLFLVDLVAHTAWGWVSVRALAGYVSLGRIRVLLSETVVAVALGYPVAHRNDQGVSVDVHTQFTM